MDERSRVLVATILGAVAGGVLGCLYLTKQGRRVRDQVEPMLDAVVAELTRARATVEKARGAAREGRRAMDDLLAARPARDPGAEWEGRDYRQAPS